ncbi:MAG: hypothetical protein HONDAALG_04548 [Gammaproteobacteria bacterium]|nr:hypothetical protein [Gammaproteobacteria bacterium]
MISVPQSARTVGRAHTPGAAYPNDDPGSFPYQSPGVVRLGGNP